MERWLKEKKNTSSSWKLPQLNAFQQKEPAIYELWVDVLMQLLQTSNGQTYYVLLI